MSIKTNDKSLHASLIKRLKHHLLSNPYLHGAFAIFFIALIFSSGYLFSSGVPADYNGDLLSNAPLVLADVHRTGYFFGTWDRIFSEIKAYGFPFPGNPLSDLQILFFQLTNDIYASLKLLQVAEIFCAGFLMFLCFYNITKKKYSGLIAGVLYMFTPFNLARVQGQIYIAWGFAFLPLAFLLIYKSMIEEKLRYAVLVGLPIWLVLTQAPENIYEIGMPLLVFSLLIMILQTEKGKIFKSIAKRFALLVVMFCVGIGMSLNNFIGTSGFFGGAVYTSSYAYYIQTSGANSFSLKPSAGLLLFDGEFLRLGIPLSYNSEIVLILGFSFVLLSAFLLIVKKNPLNLALFITGLLCMILSLGSFAPASLSLFNLAHEYLPFFSMIRTPGRFMMSSYFSFIFLSTIAIGFLGEKVQRWAFKID